MADLVLDAYDRFVVLYDTLALVNENVTGESALASSAHLSPGVAGRMLAFMLAQGFVKTAGSDSEFRVTALGSNFLREFQGTRKFLS
jgi:predicted transcriptional regulator